MQLPLEIEDMVRLAQVSVAKLIGIEPDLTSDTLPLVDQYLRQVPMDASKDVHSLVIASVGCYFGEVVRRKLNGRWIMPTSSPIGWRVELLPCFLYFWPVGMAGEIFTRAKTDLYDGSFATADELEDALADMLQNCPPISEAEYYSLSGRIDTLEMVADWLVGYAEASGKDPGHFTAEEYLRVISLKSPEAEAINS